MPLENHNALRRFYRRTAQPGYGLVLLMVFVLSALLISTSVQLLTAPTMTHYLGTLSHDNLAARELALLGLDTVVTDMQTRLNAGQTVDTSYTYPVTSVSMPNDPNSLSTLDSLVGSYSASISQARGDTYLVKLNTTVGTSTIDLYRLLQMGRQQFDCSSVENQILAGNITTISDANLIAYAQNDCMIKTGSTTVTAPTAGAGAGACGGSYTGSGIVDLATVTCNVTVGGTYNTIQYYSTTSTSGGGRYLYSYPAGGFTGIRTVHVPGTVGAGDSFRAWNSSGTRSAYPHTFLFGTPGITSSFVTRGSDGNDIFSYNGTSTSDVYTYAGDNTIIVNGTWGDASDYNTLELGESGAGHTGSNTVYINSLKGSAAAGIYTYSSGVTQLYFNNLSGGTVSVSGGTGNDIFGCGVSFTGGAGACGSASAGTYTFSGKGGSDIISINFLIPASTTVSGNTGATEETGSIGNIIYTKGSAASSTINTNNKNSLVISGGNRAGTINGQSGGNSVLLKKSGTTDSGTNSNFSRTLIY